MSTLTDADRARGLTEPEGDARDLAAKLADARRLAESAARTAARLTRERDEARESLAWWTEVQSCDLRHSEPFDFGGCETHDRTFPLGGACDHAGLSEVEWMEQREQEQRVRAIRAEEERDEARAQVAAAIDTAHLARQRNFSLRTFGPGTRTAGVLAHIRKELAEIEAEPLDLSEWADVVILALDGAWRTGAEPQQIIAAIKAKQTRNEARAWPDWRTADPDAPIEHVRES